MIRRWLWPLVAGVIVALVAYQLTLRETPRLLMKAAERRLAKGGGTNAFLHAPLATAASRAVVRPSPDLAYSSCPFDLSKGAVAITVPPMPASYWSLSVFDARTDVAFVRNNAEWDGATMRIALVTKGQSAPMGYVPVEVSGGHGVALVRILVDDRARFPAIDRARREAVCTVVKEQVAPG